MKPCVQEIWEQKGSMTEIKQKLDDKPKAPSVVL